MKKIGKACMLMLCVWGCWLMFDSRAAAETTYPYDELSCVHAPYATKGSATWCSNYDWGTKRNDTSAASTISPYGYAYRNCTDYVAWRLAAQGVDPVYYRGLGHAKSWAAHAIRHGLAVDDTPAVGAVAVRTTGTYGHVAYITAVMGQGIIQVAQYNKHGDGTFSEASGTPAALGFTRFIHFEAHIPQLTAAAAPPSVLAVAPPADMVPTSPVILPTDPVSTDTPAHAMPSDQSVPTAPNLIADTTDRALPANPSAELLVEAEVFHAPIAMPALSPEPSIEQASVVIAVPISPASDVFDTSETKDRSNDHQQPAAVISPAPLSQLDVTSTMQDVVQPESARHTWRRYTSAPPSSVAVAAVVSNHLLSQSTVAVVLAACIGASGVVGYYIAQYRAYRRTLALPAL